MTLNDGFEQKDRNDTGDLYTYRIMWGWKEDIRIVEVQGDSHHTGTNGLRVTRDGATVADFDRAAYRSFIRVPVGEEPPETVPERGEDE